MASVNFEKGKQNGKPISAYIRHNDTEERKRHTHANKDIDITKTDGNCSWKNLSSQQCEERYKKRIAKLDENPGQNKRKDRVCFFSLELSIPKEVKDKKEFFNDVMSLFEKKFGAENICQGNLHVDEIHDYVDHGEVKTSLEHIHCLVIPEINGKLNGREFSSREAMIRLNNEIDQMCKEKYHCAFMTNEKPRHQTVEELKADSEKEKLVLKTLTDKEPPTSYKVNPLTKTVSYSKEDNDRLVLLANIGSNIEGNNQKREKQEEKIKREYIALTNQKEEARRIIADANKVKKVTEQLPKITERYLYMQQEVKNTKDELKDLQQQAEKYKDILNGGLKYQIELAKIEAENTKLKEENTRLKSKISSLSDYLKQLFNDNRHRNTDISRAVCNIVKNIQNRLGKNEFNHNIERIER